MSGANWYTESEREGDRPEDWEQEPEGGSALHDSAAFFEENPEAEERMKKIEKGMVETTEEHGTGDANAKYDEDSHCLFADILMTIMSFELSFPPIINRETQEEREMTDDEKVKSILTATKLSLESKMTAGNFARVIYYLTSMIRRERNGSAYKRFHDEFDKINTFLAYQEMGCKNFQENLNVLFEIVRRNRTTVEKIAVSHVGTQPIDGTIGSRLQSLFGGAKFPVGNNLIPIKMDMPASKLENWFLDVFSADWDVIDQLSHMREYF